MWQPDYTINDRTLGLLEKISDLRSKIQTAGVHLPLISSLVRDAAVRSAHGSTAIEGCTLSVEAVKSLFDNKKVSGYSVREVRMAKNYLNAIQWVIKKEKQTTLLEKDIMNLHKVIASDAVDDGPIGKYRRVDVTAGIYSAPNWKKVPRLLKDMLEWLNSRSKQIPAIFSSSLLHLQFVNIHPFRDGNGRCARALASWELFRRGFDTLHIFSVDEILLENRSLYIKNLQRVQSGSYPIGAWLEFMSEAILETLERVYGHMMSIGIIAGPPMAITVKQEKLLRVIQERGIMGIRDIALVIKTTVPGAHYVLKPLIKRGVIVRTGHYKNVKYTVPTSIQASGK
ncbi:MAG: Fic family protein [Elusimicrobiota bacterium]|nr:Fic family protein [Elusimicrobiota bacterium]